MGIFPTIKFGGTLLQVTACVVLLSPAIQATTTYTALTDPAFTAGLMSPTLSQNLATPFTVLSPIDVTSLGVFDSAGDGIVTGPIEVAIYFDDQSGQGSLANAGYTLETPILTFDAAGSP